MPATDRLEVALVRGSGIAAELSAQWIDVVPNFAGADHPVNAVNRAIAEVIAAHADKTPLVFASDCMCTLGVMKGLEARDPDVLWYDAHGDFNTPETTVTNFLGGMPLAALVGKGNAHLREGIGLVRLSESRVSLTDARNLDEAEAMLLAESEVAHLRSVMDVTRMDWGGAPLYVHLDMDVLDPFAMPGLDYPEQGGASLDDLIRTVQHARAHGKIVGASFDLWNSTRGGDNGLALANTIKVVRAVAGV
jgi:arginase